MMTANARFSDVQTALKQNGVRDVKFMFRTQALDKPLSAFRDDVADVLSKFYAGNKTVVERLPSEELTKP